MKKNCLNCHFLCTTYTRTRMAYPTHPVFGNPVTGEEKYTVKDTVIQLDRDQLKENQERDPISGIHTNFYNCFFRVWDESLDPNMREQRKAFMIDRDRKDFCFFWPFHYGMSLEAAQILQEREQKNEDQEKALRLTRLGIWIATGVLLLNAIFQFLNRYWPIK